MPANKNYFYKIILLVLTLLVLITGMVVFLTPSAIFPDPSWGYQVMRAMQMGGGFNLLFSPDPANLAKNITPFLSWWSPGQYLVPYLFKLVLGINTGQASALTSTLCTLCGLAGFFYFFKKLGFTNIITAVSLIVIACQRAFWMPFAFYNGGEVLLFAFEGWFLYGCVTFVKTDWKLILFVLLSGWIGFICKSSFVWIYVAGLLCLWIRLSTGQHNVWGWVKKGFWLGIPAVISMATIYLLYLSKGENPSSASGGFKFAFEAFEFPLASPLLAGFSIDDMINGVLFHTDKALFSPGPAMVILGVSMVISILLILAILKFVPGKDYKLFIIVFYSVSVLFFSWSFLKQSAISYEGRHLRIVGLLIVPGVIYIISKTNLYWQSIFLLVCIGIGHSSYHFTRIMHKGNGLSAHGPSGVAQLFIDQPSLNYIMALDRQKKDALFVFISADIGLEIQRNRIITLEPYDAEIADEDRVPYLGHAGPIYMVLPADYTGSKLATMIKYFPGYKNFLATPLSKNYMLYTAQ